MERTFGVTAISVVDIAGPTDPAPITERGRRADVTPTIIPRVALSAAPADRLLKDDAEGAGGVGYILARWALSIIGAANAADQIWVAHRSPRER